MPMIESDRVWLVTVRAGEARGALHTQLEPPGVQAI
jgi:hypothetical protein